MTASLQDWQADILMVDDDAGNLLALEALLEPMGQRLHRARSGEEALRMVLKCNPSVILLDVRMPGMDGFETARMIRLRERSRLTPIIFLTGLCLEIESAFRGYEVGAVDYLMKPVVPEVLRAKVAVFVALGKINAELTREIAERQLAEEQMRELALQLPALAVRLIDVREEERAGIARDIERELGQVLSGLKTDLGWLAGELAGGDPVVLEKIAAMGRLIDSTIDSIGGIATGLRPAILGDKGLIPALRWQADQMQERTGIGFRLDLPDEPLVLDGALSTTVLRIFQEILTNIARHAKADRVEVSLIVGDTDLDLTVMDDGIGISESQIHGQESLGLSGLQERAQIFGGKVSIHGNPAHGLALRSASVRRIPAHGTTVSVSIPMNRRERRTKNTSRTAVLPPS